MLAISLAHYAEKPVDLNRVIRMLLVHDIGEIDTGDTMVFIEEGLAARKAAELAAVTRIFGMLPATLALANQVRTIPTILARSFLHCGKSLNTVRRPNRVLPTPWTGDAVHAQPGQRRSKLEGKRHQL